MWSRLALALLSLCFATHCTRNNGACTANSECSGGQACVNGTCATLCRADNECPSGERCDGDHCVIRGATDGAPPIIQAVNGTGSVDSADGHMTRHLRDRLLITGYNLANATAQLLPESGPPYDLPPCATPLDTELQVRMPPGLAAGRYSLVVANQAGVCDASLQILQGEPGSLNASGSLIVDSINDALAADPALRLRGSLPTGDKISFVTAVGTEATGASSIVVNDAEQIGAGENTAAGVYLVIVDLATHQVVVDSAGSGMTSKGPFAAGEAQKLADVLAWADLNAAKYPDYAVILASTGDISAMAAAAGGAVADGLWLELQKIGASQRARSLTATEAYVLIGQKGIGEGNGLERIAGAGRSGVAATGATIVGNVIQGITTVTGLPLVRGALTARTASVDVAGTLNASGRATAGGYTATAPSFYVRAGGCLSDDVEAAAYRTVPATCGGDTSVCSGCEGNSCTTGSHAWRVTKSAETCTYYDCGLGPWCGISCARSCINGAAHTCSATIWSVCNPTLE
ncbi:MAG: hypothetical protein HY903_23185 [Deltaproteobacteria bacterium]|nr:hypothetical protein [Deltaproteobacteria bacterium]